ncbi:MAG: site-2 protease family protein, partial [Candidatus Micrarchaeota archaeon]|nr:site-2 protease family protein [Candidatus Micrarchaeota archaeon]
DLMKNIAKTHPKIVNALADFGLSFGFGAIYSFFLFRKTPKKLLVHLALILLLFAVASFSTSVPTNPLILQAVGVLFGLAGIGFVSIAMNAFNILTIPGTPAGVLPVVPGVTVPWEAIFAIALIAIVHETAHGVLFFIEKLKVKNSGVLLLGFLPIGAFVEPDEKQFTKHGIEGRRRILVAGSASNFYTMLILLPFSAIAFTLVASMVSGVLISSVAAGSPADGLLQPSDVITGINGVSTPNIDSLVKELKNAASGMEQTISLQLLDGRIIPINLDSEGKMGIQISPYSAPANAIPYAIASFFAEILKWSVLLSLALSVINLLPLFITDGHHLIADEINQLLPKNPKLAKATTNGLAVLTLLIILLNALPLIK